MENKSPLKSKTVWFNLGLIALGLVEQVAQTGAVGGPWLLPVIGAIGAGLRFITAQPIAQR